MRLDRKGKDSFSVTGMKMDRNGKRYRRASGKESGGSSGVKNRNRKIAALLVLVFLAAAGIYTMYSSVKPGTFSMVMEPGSKRKVGGDYKDWESSNPTVVEVDQKGNLSALRVGRATVTAQGDWGRSYKCQVTVCAINEKDLVLAAGDSFQLQLEGAENQKVRWESADKRVASVDDQGLVKAVKGGSVLIFCRVGDYEIKCRVNIPSLAQDTLVLSRQGYARIKILNGGQEEVSYWSGDERVARVSEDGLVTGLEEGITTIYCQLGDVTLNQEVEVTAMDEASLVITPGQTYKINVNGIAGGKWSSEDPSIASVDQNGRVTGMKLGHTRVKMVKDGSTFLTDVSVAGLEETEVTISLDEGTYTPQLVGASGPVEITVENEEVAEGGQGQIILKAAGDTRVYVSCQEAVMELVLHVTVPQKLVTNMTDLPMETRKARVTVTIHSYPGDRTYTVFNQADGKNKTRKFPHYMPAHGCAACSTSVVLTGFGIPMTPADMVEKVERVVLGDKWEKNYSRDHRHRMPMTLYGITRVLDRYKIANTYVRTFKDGEAKKQILEHLLTGRPVIFEVKNYNRYKNKKSTKWANSYHTMVFLGVTDTGKVIVADPANRSSKTFGTMGRLKYVDIDEVIPYMFSCTSATKHNYFSTGATAGGYILIDQ